MNKKTSTFNEVDVLKNTISNLLKEGGFTSKDYVSIVSNQKKKLATINCRTTVARNKIFVAMKPFTILKKTGTKTVIVNGIRPTKKTIVKDSLYDLVWKMYVTLNHLKSITKQRFSNE